MLKYGDIHPHVSRRPNARETDTRPVLIALLKPKSDILARTRPDASGTDRRVLFGLGSLCTEII